jgi:hypothetical protein
MQHFVVSARVQQTSLGTAYQQCAQRLVRVAQTTKRGLLKTTEAHAHGLGMRSG